MQTIEAGLNLPTWPHFSEDEIAAVCAVLRSGKVNTWTGNQVTHFEKAFSAYVGCNHGIALANGTLALELALHALNIGPGDEVIVPCRTFIATASAVVALGAVPIVADIDSQSQTITAQTIKAQLSPRTKAIIVVHLAGWPCEMTPILALAKEHDLKVIEDCAQAHGARYHDRLVGSFGDMAAFSFCQDKIMTTGGEGGMLVTNQEELWERAWSYKDHGKHYPSVFRTDHPPGFRWLHQRFGSNWRMTEMQAAIGLIQLTKLPEWVRLRQANAAILDTYLKPLEALRVPTIPSYIQHAYYKYYAFTNSPCLERDTLLLTLNQLGIPCQTGICPEIYLEQAFISKGLGPKQRFPAAKALGETSLMFQIHPTLTSDHMHYIGEEIMKAVHCIKHKITT